MKQRLTFLIVLLALASGLIRAQSGSYSSPSFGGALTVQQGGSSQGTATTINCSTNVTCSVSAGVATVTASASGSTAWSAITGSASNTNTGFTLAPTATGTVPWTHNCPTGITVDCLDWELNAVKEMWIDSSGIVHFNQAIVGSAASLTSFPTLNQNTTGTAANLSGTPALPNGATATTQAAASNDTKLATDAYVDGHFIANGTAAMGTSAIASGTCATVVTVSAAGVATTDVVSTGFNGDPTAVTGYGASATGAVLTIYPYPTSGNVNFKVCNSTASSITPSALTLNWKVTR